MKRIILGLSVLLIAQNGFALSDAKFDEAIQNTTGFIKQNIKCEKEANNHQTNANINECLKAIEMLESSNQAKAKELLPNILRNTGVLYYLSEKDYLKAYKYYLKAAKLGDTGAQEALDIVCREHSWVCK